MTTSNNEQLSYQLRPARQLLFDFVLLNFRNDDEEDYDTDKFLSELTINLNDERVVILAVGHKNTIRYDCNMEISESFNRKKIYEKIDNTFCFVEHIQSRYITEQLSGEYLNGILFCMKNSMTCNIQKTDMGDVGRVVEAINKKYGRECRYPSQIFSKEILVENVVKNVWILEF